MKYIIRFAAAFAAFLILFSCSVVKGQKTSSDATSVGSSTGTSLLAIYNVLKATGAIDLSKVSNVVNLGNIITGASAVSNASTGYLDLFSKGLVSGSQNLVNSSNVSSVISGLKSLGNIDTSAITKAAAAAAVSSASSSAASSSALTSALGAAASAAAAGSAGSAGSSAGSAAGVAGALAAGLASSSAGSSAAGLASSSAGSSAAGAAGLAGSSAAGALAASVLSASDPNVSSAVSAITSLVGLLGK